MTRLTLALDVMSGDFGPCVTVPAAVQVLSSIPSLYLLLAGQPDAISPFLTKVEPALLQRLSIIPADTVIPNEAKPSYAIRNSRGSSMRIALELVKRGDAQAVVSAGNTGALMGLAKLLLKPLAGIERPALMTTLPNQQKSKTVLLDLGANIESSALMLVQFAIMGAVVAEEIVGISQPRIALLNIGEEENKGLENIREAAALLKNRSAMNFIGYLEGNELLTGKADVLVCDGFVGNITLKTMEGVARMFLSLLNSGNPHANAWWQRKLIIWIKSKIMKRLIHLNPDQYNGAYLIGLGGTVIKSHGAANQKAFAVAIEQAILAVQRQIPERIALRLNMVLPKSD